MSTIKKAVRFQLNGRTVSTEVWPHHTLAEVLQIFSRTERSHADATELACRLPFCACLNIRLTFLGQQQLWRATTAGMTDDMRRRLLSVGRYALRGVSHPQELFTIDPEVST